MTTKDDQANDSTTHFGFKTVSPDEKTNLVTAVFDSVAGKYDLMNDLMSFGLHRLWKRYAVALSSVRPGQSVLDLAGGTGDVTRLFAERVGPTGRVVLADINASMLSIGRDRLVNRGVVGNLNVVQANAETLPFLDNQFDIVSIAFGLRNVTRKEVALAEMYRVLKPAGRLLVLEFSQPQQPLLSKAYDLYSFQVLPQLGKLITQDAASYRYLAESIRRHPDQEQLANALREAGFSEVQYHNLLTGIVALHRGIKC